MHYVSMCLSFVLNDKGLISEDSVNVVFHWPVQILDLVGKFAQCLLDFEWSTADETVTVRLGGKL